jgi:proline iminopeptidase
MIDDRALVHRYDQRACGQSSGGPPHTMARSIADLEALRRHWGYERWIVGGVSFGAALALAYAVAHPERVAALVYVSCAVRLSGQPDWTERFRRTRVERLSAPERARYLDLQRRRDERSDADPALATEARRLIATTDFGRIDVARRMMPRVERDMAAVNRQVNRELGDDFDRHFLAPGVRDRIQALDRPALIVHGEADPRPAGSAAALAAALPQARLAILPGIGHYVLWEAPDTLRDLLRGLIASIRG